MPVVKVWIVRRPSSFVCVPQIAPWCLPEIMAVVEAKWLAGFVLNVEVTLSV